MTHPGSLVEQVHSCIVGEPECGHMQARAAICAVADWMASSGSHCLADAARVLRREVDCIPPSAAIE